jgi:hypothetical protein
VFFEQAGLKHKAIYEKRNMIKTLRITTIIAAILAVGFLAFPVVYGYRYQGVEEIEQFLISPGAVERFKQAKGAKRVKGGDQVSPLVKQAMGFSLYLNPPRKLAAPKPPRQQVARQQVPDIPGPIGPVSVKFTLIGTSYYESRPELSLAYIDEPGKGMHWVRQGAKVAHLLIQEVQDGSVIVKDHDKTITLVAARTPKKSLLKSDETSKSTTALPGASTSITSTVSEQASARTGMPPALPTGAAESAVAARSAVMPTAPPRLTVPRASMGAPGMSAAEQDAVLADFIKELKAMNSSEYSAEEKAALQEAIVDFEAMRITAGEAQKIGRLGKELGNVEGDPERAKTSKVQSRPPPSPPRRPQPPRRLPRK